MKSPALVALAEALERAANAAPHPDVEVVPDTREAKVGHVMGLMAGDLWIDGGESIAALARSWSMAEGSVAHIASEARRRVTSSIDPGAIGKIVASTCHRGLTAAVSMAEGGDPKALNGIAAIARVYSGMLPTLTEKKPSVDDPPVFRIELTTPERPPPAAPEVPCPSGSSSPPAGDPAPG